MKPGLNLEQQLAALMSHAREVTGKHRGAPLTNGEALIALRVALAAIATRLQTKSDFEENDVSSVADISEPFRRLSEAIDLIQQGHDAPFIAPRRKGPGQPRKEASEEWIMAIGAAAIFLAKKGDHKKAITQKVALKLKKTKDEVTYYHKNLRKKINRGSLLGPALIYELLISGNWQTLRPEDAVEEPKRERGEKPSSEEVLNFLNWQIRSKGY